MEPLTEAEHAELIARLKAGHKGEDVPCMMAAAGCDYDMACDLVFDGKHDEALALLERTRAIVH